MEARALVPTYELFVILESLQQYLPEFSAALEPLKTGDVPLVGCDIYYREDTDVALLALRFDRRGFDDRSLEWIHEVSGQAGLAVLDPSMLPAPDRARFYDQYLEEYPLRSRGNSTAAAALAALAEILGLRPPSRRPEGGTSEGNSDTVPAARAKSARGDIELEELAEEVSVSEFCATPAPALGSSPSARNPARNAAKSDGDELDLPRPGGRSPHLPTLRLQKSDGVPQVLDDGPTHPVETPLEVVSLDQALGVNADDQRVPPPLPPVPNQRPGEMPQPLGKRSRGLLDPGPADEQPTRPGRPSRLGSDSGEKRVVAEETPQPTRRRSSASERLPATRALSPRRLARARNTVRPPARPASSDRILASPTNPPRPARGTRPPSLDLAPQPAADAPPTITVRLRRGDEWVPARLRSLSLKGAYIACGAPPRLHDDVHIALGLGNAGTVVRGTVVHVTDPVEGEDSATGTCGFGLVFASAETPSRRQLKELLQTARTKGVVLEPPPSRGAVRFPVRWPVRFILPDRRGLDLSALDVSRSGMFVSTLERLPAGNLDFVLPTESGASISGRARVVREVPWKMAAARGISTGFGMEITSVADEPDNSFNAFVERIRQRVQYKVLVGASTERTEELSAGLVAAGYAVSAASELKALLHQARRDPRPPDAALIDSSLQLSIDGNNQLCAGLATKRVPLVNIGGEAPQRARAIIDSLLQID